MKLLALPLIAAVALSIGSSPDKKPKLSVKANPAMGLSPVRVVATADLSGTTNADEEFYCAGIEWEWGDDTRSSDAEDCDPFVAGKSEVKTRFVASHTFHTAGEYRILFRLKRKDKTLLTGSTSVRVREGAGDVGNERCPPICAAPAEIR
jgi:hypothetical protein